MRRSPHGDKKGFSVASILESKELLLRMSHESSLEPLKVYHLDMQSSFRSYINYTNGTPQLCWGWSNWLQNCRFRVAVQSRELRAQPAFCEEQKPSIENSQVCAGFKVMLKNYKNISAIVSENRKRCEPGGSKGRECSKLCTTNTPVNFNFCVALQHWKAMSNCTWQGPSPSTNSPNTTDRYRQGSARSQHLDPLLCQATARATCKEKTEQSTPFQKCHLSE